MVILGIDPGVATTGYGVIKFSESGESCIFVYGIISSSARERFSKRLLKIYQELKKIIKKYKPDLLAIENIYFAKNAKTAINVGKAIGVILLLGEEKKIPFLELTPLQVKQSLTGFGRADKAQVQNMVKRLLGLSKIPKPDDAADALAMALTAHQYNKTYEKNKACSS
ncbi:crossover junction endodeoxyribonuclease RuvC [bacterium (Candidatus Moisslbacteria) CG12_big_fil_rev_8_21_14_0_65_36_11]|nr:crossover junction endodeoxyribonuclease RuvC [Candidatus Kuenenbacteria bacterium]OIP76303.1 MAG: crossover junction endodeoxyribonuclease RuvC [Parcubacteria group bacterium CG2_30_36_38]PIV45930.1 MAG: crossover junction endodeoxyribonuclease RuvC [bacterium (Candidatus Moisslbacteria) CG02_land_8_20_14_3_00_36_53]PIW68039.1 MAG: crossover junction endodeoxyribonuclease RuvC [bacterium (Candidatus Moisslbacteria) CG12_big_fil_rev_8_21_14_0_65_36_11]PIZ90190.1 MAG: crossover junction endod